MHNPPHILIVDADTSAARATRKLVERVKPDATVSIEAAADLGMLSARHSPPDILIIDPSPENRSDEQLIEQIKAEFPEVRVIALTSSSTPTMRRRMLQLGVDLYIEKPSAPLPLIDGLRAMFAAP
jgi:DNA-binding NarL/FixJ family response regulator